jgi:ribosomal protein S18 acetylase RimI-like enzyme
MMTEQISQQPSLQARHPQHDEVAQAVRAWFRQPFDGMGYRSQVRSFGTYWSTGMVYPSPAAANDLDAFLADLRARYGPEQVVLNLDDRRLEETMAPALLAAGWREGESDKFLAHTAIAPASNPRPGLALEPVTEDNLREFALVGLVGFDEAEHDPTELALAAEMARRRQEIEGSGRGLLARFEDVPAGILRWFDDPLDIWIRGLAVRPAYRRRGIGSALVQRRLADGYAVGQRSLLINVALGNQGAQRLYRRLGFADEVYRRRQFIQPASGD